uniref:Uncharacterized protein n=1 Tax=Arundo donax TaxID=35708 RepID=A0A0A9AI13_ARUDO
MGFVAQRFASAMCEAILYAVNARSDASFLSHLSFNAARVP